MKKLFYGSLVLVTLALIGLYVQGFSTSLETQIAKGYEGQYTSLENVDLRVWQQGQGPDVLLIHGLPGSIEDWDPIRKELAKRYRVTVYDRPGHGFSAHNKTLSNLSGNIDTVFALIEKLALKDVILVGHSYGGTIVSAIATQKPSNIKGYVAVAALVQTHKPVDPIYRIITLPTIGKGVAKLGNEFIGKHMMKTGLADAFFPNDMPNGFMQRRESIWLKVKNALATAYEEVNIPSDLQSLTATELSRANQPFYILHGEEDQSVPISNARVLHQAIPTAKLMLEDNTGHMFQYVHPGKVIQAIDAIDNAAAIP